MCIVFFQTNPSAKVKLFVLFNRDEVFARPRLPLQLTNGVLCGIDVQSQGTWFGVNATSKRVAWLTNYDHKPFLTVTDPQHRRGQLLINYLQS